MHDYSFYKDGIEKLFFIVDKEMQSVPFKLNPPQDRMLKELAGQDIILKARQEGISSLVLAIFALDFVTVENIRCVVISHEDRATQRLFDRAKYFIESVAKTFPGEAPIKLKYNTKKEMVNTVKNSTFYVGTAGGRAFGHGETINNLHISELSRWPNQEKTMVGLLQAVPKDGRIIIESTANGWGDYFYRLWLNSKAGKTPFKTHFIPWFELPEYVFPVNSLTMDTLIEEEKNLINTYHLTFPQLAWRRWKIGQMGGDPLDPESWHRFNEQFPSTAEEAFIFSGNTVWSPNLLRHYFTHCNKPHAVGNLRGYNPISIEPNEKGYVKIWKEPDEFHTYAIGVDVSEGKVVSQGEEGKTTDASCAQVFDKTTYEQVASWHGWIDPDQLGRQLDMLGKYYNNALIGVERNAVGLTPLITLRDLGYPNLYYREKMGLVSEKVTSELGWVTDSISKESLISDATHLLRDKYIKINDEDTVEEMKSFVRDTEGHAGAERGAHDDRVMAFLIGMRMLARAKSVSTQNEIEKDESDIAQSKGFYMSGVSFNSKGMPVPEDQMDEDVGESF